MYVMQPSLISYKRVIGESLMLVLFVSAVLNHNTCAGPFSLLEHCSNSTACSQELNRERRKPFHLCLVNLVHFGFGLLPCLLVFPGPFYLRLGVGKLLHVSKGM